MTHVKLLTYNTKLLPAATISQVGPFTLHQRAAHIADVVGLRDYDVICFQEVFDEDCRGILTSQLQPYGYRCSPKIDGGNAINQDSGLFLATKNGVCSWDGPLDFQRYRSAKSFDRFANKGIAGLRLKIHDTNGASDAIWVFLTHTQADAKYSDVRRDQFAQARDFIAQRLSGEPNPELVCAVFAGDMNVIGATAERDRMREVLCEPIDQYYAEHNDENPGYTWDGPNNPMAGGQSRERLDYWLAFDAIPNANGAGTSLRLADRRAIEVEKMRFRGAYLSDHYAVRLELDL